MQTTSLNYERGPELGNLVIDESADSVCVRIAAETIGTWRIVRAAATWAFLAIGATLIATAMPLSYSDWSGRISVWGVCAVFVLVATWAIWPRRRPMMYLLATPQRFEFTCGDRHYELERAQVTGIVSCISPPIAGTKHPVSVVIRLTNGSEYVVGWGSLDEAEAITTALKRGLRINSDS